MEPQRRYRQTSHAHFKALGYTNEEIQWTGRNPVNGFDPVKRKPYAGVSEYDSTKWPAESSYAPNDKTRKKKIAAKFALNGNDIIDLCYIQRRFPASRLIAHEYLSVELEYRAWDKYGGPAGLNAALERRARRQANRGAAAQRRRRQGDDVGGWEGHDFPLAILNIFPNGLGGGFGVPFPEYQHQRLLGLNPNAMPALMPEVHGEEIQALEGQQLEDHADEAYDEVADSVGGDVEIEEIQAPGTPRPRPASILSGGSHLQSPPPTAPRQRTSAESKFSGLAGQGEDADVEPVPRTLSPNCPSPASMNPADSVAESSSTKSPVRDLTRKGKGRAKYLHNPSSGNVKDEKPELDNSNTSLSNVNVISASRPLMSPLLFPSTSSLDVPAGTELKRKRSPSVDIDLTIGDDLDDCLVPISPARKRLKESAKVAVIDVIDISDD